MKMHSKNFFLFGNQSPILLWQKIRGDDVSFCKYLYQKKKDIPTPKKLTHLYQKYKS